MIVFAFSTVPKVWKFQALSSGITLAAVEATNTRRRIARIAGLLAIVLAAAVTGPPTGGDVEQVNLADKLASFTEHWSPKIVGELNGQHVKLAKFQGEFVWHSHADEDELFMVLHGSFEMLFRDRTVTVGEGEFLIVPRGEEHCPRAEQEVHVLLFEPVETVNTGTAGGERTVSELERI